MDELISSYNWMVMEGAKLSDAEVEHLLAGLDVQQSLRALTSLTVNHQVNFTI